MKLSLHFAYFSNDAVAAFVEGVKQAPCLKHVAIYGKFLPDKGACLVEAALRKGVCIDLRADVKTAHAETWPWLLPPLETCTGKCAVEFGRAEEAAVSFFKTMYNMLDPRALKKNHG